MSTFKMTEFQEKEISVFYQLISRTENSTEQLLKEKIHQLKTIVSPEQVLNSWFKGGYPEPLIESSNTQEFYYQWMEQYIQSYISRDIRGLFPKLNIHQQLHS